MGDQGGRDRTLDVKTRKKLPKIKGQLRIANATSGMPKHGGKQNLSFGSRERERRKKREQKSVLIMVNITPAQKLR